MPLGSDTSMFPAHEPDHDCPSAQELRELRQDVREMSKGLKELRQILIESSTDRSSVLDKIRKHDAQIETLQGSSWANFVAKTFVASVIGLGTTFVFGLLAKGVIVEILQQVQKVHP